MNIKVSIVMASYNYEKLIGKAIDSVISQSYNDWELIIVDDGSTDNSVNIIRNYVDSNSKIKMYQHKNGVNKGLKESLFLGLKHSKGQYIAFLESDDWWENNYLEEKINVLKKVPSIEFIFNDVEIFSDEKMDLSWFNNYFKWQKEVLNSLKMPCKCSKFFTKKNFVPTFSCVFVKKKTLLKCDFNSPVDALLDFWLWSQLSSKTDFYYIDKILTHWLRHNNSYINTSTKERRKKLKVYNKARVKFLNVSKTDFVGDYFNLLKNIFYLKYKV